MFKNVEQLVWK